MYKPENDGIDHINVYSKGKTKLGRFLTNFAYSPFEHPEDGKFDSVEGYWYWLLSRGQDDARHLRSLSGFKAKELGRELSGTDWSDNTEFKNRIKQAIFLKVTANAIWGDFARSELPFAHYYVYGGKVVPVPKSDWIIQYLEELRLFARSVIKFETDMDKFSRTIGMQLPVEW